MSSTGVGPKTVLELVLVAPLPAAKATVWPRRVAFLEAVVLPSGRFAMLPHELETMSIHGCDVAQFRLASPRPSTMTISAFGLEPKNWPAATLATPVPWPFSSMIGRSGY